MPFFTDALGRTIKLTNTPQRIVSVVPSQTELLYDLGLEKEVVGITKFCIHPAEWFRTKPRVGGTKNLNLEKIKALQPNLILANKEENVKEQIEELALHFPVWVSDINTLPDALQMILSIGVLVEKEEAAKALVQEIDCSFQQLQQTVQSTVKAAYLIWKDPYITVGGDTFINDLLQRAGFINVFADQKRYPQVTMEQLQKAECEWLLLSSEPYPFAQKHIDELQPLLPHTKILLVDGELFSWYGSRLRYSAHYFQNLRKQIQAV